MRPGLALDSSALIAIMKSEPEARAFMETISHSDCVIGWPTAFEVRTWIIHRARSAKADELLSTILEDTRIVPFDRSLYVIAGVAYERFGRGRHPAALNFGDCFAYAVAKREGLPLLFKGADFGRTDIAVHPASVLAAA